MQKKAFRSRFDPKGFWREGRFRKTVRVNGKEKRTWEWNPAERRPTLLALVAFHDLQEKIAACGGNVAKGVDAFCSQNNGEGWMLPETLRLADYGLGHDDRAKEHQPVRECFGPRFHDWQLAQTPEESWKECHLHARNLLGAEGYQKLLDEIEGRNTASLPATLSTIDPRTGTLFDTTNAPLFQEPKQ
jgi:hypothetical protein